MEGWAEFVDEMKQYYGVSMECLSGAERGVAMFWGVVPVLLARCWRP